MINCCRKDRLQQWQIETPVSSKNPSYCTLVVLVNVKISHEQTAGTCILVMNVTTLCTFPGHTAMGARNPTTGVTRFR